MRIPLALLLVASLRLPGADWAGQWSDPQLTLQLQGPATALTGNLTLGGQRFPVQALESGDGLQGSFRANGEDFPFQAALVGEVLVLTSAGETYRLERKGANPLKKPANPLAKRPTVVDPLVGSWRNEDGEVVVLRADGSAQVGGAAARWTSADQQITLTTSEGTTSIPYRLAGDQLSVVVEGTRVGYTRVAAASEAPAATATAANAGPDTPLSEAALQGVWLGPEGTYRLGAGGQGFGQGKAFQWTVQGAFLVFSQDGKQLQVPARLRADKLILGSGPVVECERATGAAGFWSGSDTSVDPTLILNLTHHIAFYPDGTVGYQKGELGAGRSQGWFSYRREQSARKTVGRWQQDGGAVRFNLGSGTYRARFNEARQRLVVLGMGQVNEGADVEFARE